MRNRSRPGTPQPSSISLARRPSVRCAVYTRKSTEEGLEQDFNSLHAQREACEAYIASQRHEGWTLVPVAYDDGGYSGGSMERPGLQALLSDIRSRLVDVVVVYKVDRLTRSLADFAKMVETFDASSVSFVSVTQSFNTTSSMGRLTLNVLLSFAQFEREVTGERIRDKIAASKKKGLWMGGTVPIGYEAAKRTLRIVKDDAAVIRMIYQRYLDLRSVGLLSDELDRRAIRTKAFVSASGRTWGNRPFSRGHLYLILSNPIYIGEISHKGDRYPGQHAAIIDRAMFDAVQAQLAANTRGRTLQSRATEPAPLAGLVFDHRGHRLWSTHTVKKGRRYRYYVANVNSEEQVQAIGGSDDHFAEQMPPPRRCRRPPRVRIPAGDIERLVLDGLATKLTDRGWLTRSLLGANPAELIGAIERAAEFADIFKRPDVRRQREALLDIVRTIVVHPDRVDIKIANDALARGGGKLGSSSGDINLRSFEQNDARIPSDSEAAHQESPALRAATWAELPPDAQRNPVAGATSHKVERLTDSVHFDDPAMQTITISLPAAFEPSNRSLHHVSEPSSPTKSSPDRALIKAIARGVIWYDALVKGEHPTIASLAASENVDEAYVRQRLKLALLAPDIISRAMGGESIQIDLAEIPRGFESAIIWEEQRWARANGNG